MKITNTSEEIIEVYFQDKDPVTLKRGESVEGDVVNLPQIKRSVRIGENLTEVKKSGMELNG